MKKAYFRVDSSYFIGSGHLMRCLTLAEELKKEGFQIQFICRELPGNLIDIAENHGFAVSRLYMPEGLEYQPVDGDYNTWLGVSWEQDAEETIKIIKGKSLDWLIIDHYSLDIRWEKKLRPYVKKIMVIDDLANRPHDCDLLLDQNLVEDMEKRYEGLLPSYCVKLVGPQYALLRPEFREARKRLKKRDGTVKRMLIFFGGSDPTNETEKALKAVLMLNRPDITVDVVVGKTNPHREKIKELCSVHPNVNYYCQVNNMAELMAKAGLAIGAGGATTWERCYMGLPAIVIDIAENQKMVTNYLAKLGFIIYLGFKEEIDIYMINREIVKIIENKDILLSVEKKCYELKVGGLNIVSYIL